MLYDKLDKYFKMSTEHFIYKDMEEIENICNEVLANGEVDVIHSRPPVGNVKIHKVGIEYQTNEGGFVLPQTVRFRLFH